MRGADTVHHEQYISQRTQQAAAFSLTERRMFATVYKLSAPKRLREKVPGNLIGNSFDEEPAENAAQHDAPEVSNQVQAERRANGGAGNALDEKVAGHRTEKSFDDRTSNTSGEAFPLRRGSAGDSGFEFGMGLDYTPKMLLVFSRNISLASASASVSFITPGRTKSSASVWARTRRYMLYLGSTNSSLYASL